MPRVDVYEADDGWRWRRLADNHELVAESGEAYVDRSGAVRAAERENPRELEAGLIRIIGLDDGA